MIRFLQGLESGPYRLEVIVAGRNSFGWGVHSSLCSTSSLPGLRLYLVILSPSRLSFCHVSSLTTSFSTAGLHPCDLLRYRRPDSRSFFTLSSSLSSTSSTSSWGHLLLRPSVPFSPIHHNFYFLALPASCTRPQTSSAHTGFPSTPSIRSA